MGFEFLKHNFHNEQIVGFVFPSNEENEEPKNDQRQSSEILLAMLSFCFRENSGMNQSFRRFVAMCYVVKPSLIGNATIRELAKEFGLSPHALNRVIQEVKILMKFRKPDPKYQVRISSEQLAKPRSLFCRKSKVENGFFNKNKEEESA
jgi:hypothetical protein